MPLLVPVAAACVEAVKAEATILPPSVPAKAAAPTVLRAAANAANAAVPAPAPAAAGTAEARTAVDLVPPSPVAAEVEVEAMVHPPYVAAKIAAPEILGAAANAADATPGPDRDDGRRRAAKRKGGRVAGARTAAAADQRGARSGSGRSTRRGIGTTVDAQSSSQNRPEHVPSSNYEGMAAILLFVSLHRAKICQILLGLSSSRP